MKIWFETNLLPEHVEFMWEIFKVTPFADHPWQCFKCQKFGHNAKFCTSNQKCVICSEDHSYKECPNKENVKCSNCGKNHAASYGGCVAMKKEMEIQKVRTKENLSYRDAAIKISKPQKRLIIQSINQERQGQTIEKNQEYRNSTNNKEYKTISTQTVNTGTQTKESNQIYTEEKLAAFMLEVLNQVLSSNTTMTKRTAVVTKAIENHFGKKISIVTTTNPSRVSIPITPGNSASTTNKKKAVEKTLNNGR